MSTLFAGASGHGAPHHVSHPPPSSSGAAGVGSGYNILGRYPPPTTFPSSAAKTSAIGATTSSLTPASIYASNVTSTGTPTPSDYNTPTPTASKSLPPEAPLQPTNNGHHGQNEYYSSRSTSSRPHNTNANGSGNLGDTHESGNFTYPTYPTSYPTQNPTPTQTQGYNSISLDHNAHPSHLNPSPGPSPGPNPTLNPTSSPNFNPKPSPKPSTLLGLGASDNHTARFGLNNTLAIRPDRGYPVLSPNPNNPGGAEQNGNGAGGGGEGAVGIRYVPSPRSELLSSLSTDLLAGPGGTRSTSNGHTSESTGARKERKKHEDLLRKEREKELANVGSKDLLKLVMDQERDAERMRRLIRAAYQKVEEQTKKAQELERLNQDALHRFKLLQESRLQAQEEARIASQEVRVYKEQLGEAKKEIDKAEEAVKGLEKGKEEAEKQKERERKENERLRKIWVIEKAREEGRREGFETGFRHAHNVGGGPDPLEGISSPKNVGELGLGLPSAMMAAKMGKQTSGSAHGPNPNPHLNRLGLGGRHQHQPRSFSDTGHYLYGRKNDDWGLVYEGEGHEEPHTPGSTPKHLSKLPKQHHPEDRSQTYGLGGQTHNQIPFPHPIVFPEPKYSNHSKSKSKNKPHLDSHPDSKPSSSTHNHRNDLNQFDDGHFGPSQNPNPTWPKMEGHQHEDQHEFEPEPDGVIASDDDGDDNYSYNNSSLVPTPQGYERNLPPEDPESFPSAPPPQSQLLSSSSAAAPFGGGHHQHQHSAGAFPQHMSGVGLAPAEAPILPSSPGIQVYTIDIPSQDHIERHYSINDQDRSARNRTKKLSLTKAGRAGIGGMRFGKGNNGNNGNGANGGGGGTAVKVAPGIGSGEQQNRYYESDAFADEEALTSQHSHHQHHQQPPDNYIPNVSGDGAVQVPPAHEFAYGRRMNNVRPSLNEAFSPTGVAPGQASSTSLAKSHRMKASSVDTHIPPPPIAVDGASSNGHGVGHVPPGNGIGNQPASAGSKQPWYQRVPILRDLTVSKRKRRASVSTGNPSAGLASIAPLSIMKKSAGRASADIPRAVGSGPDGSNTPEGPATAPGQVGTPNPTSADASAAATTTAPASVTLHDPLPPRPSTSASSRSNATARTPNKLVKPPSSASSSSGRPRRDSQQSPDPQQQDYKPQPETWHTILRERNKEKRLRLIKEELQRQFGGTFEIGSAVGSNDGSANGSGQGGTTVAGGGHGSIALDGATAYSNGSGSGRTRTGSLDMYLSRLSRTTNGTSGLGLGMPAQPPLRINTATQRNPHSQKAVDALRYGDAEQAQKMNQMRADSAIRTNKERQEENGGTRMPRTMTKPIKTEVPQPTPRWDRDPRVAVGSFGPSGLVRTQQDGAVLAPAPVPTPTPTPAPAPITTPMLANITKHGSNRTAKTAATGITGASTPMRISVESPSQHSDLNTAQATLGAASTNTTPTARRSHRDREKEVLEPLTFDTSSRRHRREKDREGKSSKQRSPTSTGYTPQPTPASIAGANIAGLGKASSAALASVRAAAGTPTSIGVGETAATTKARQMRATTSDGVAYTKSSSRGLANSAESGMQRHHSEQTHAHTQVPTSRKASANSNGTSEHKKDKSHSRSQSQAQAYGGHSAESSSRRHHRDQTGGSTSTIPPAAPAPVQTSQLLSPAPPPIQTTPSLSTQLQPSTQLLSPTSLNRTPSQTSLREAGGYGRYEPSKYVDITSFVNNEMEPPSTGKKSKSSKRDKNPEEGGKTKSHSRSNTYDSFVDHGKEREREREREREKEKGRSRKTSSRQSYQPQPTTAPISGYQPFLRQPAKPEPPPQPPQPIASFPSLMSRMYEQQPQSYGAGGPTTGLQVNPTVDRLSKASSSALSYR